MYQIRQARKQGGSVLLTLPPGIAPGYYYVSIEDQEREPQHYLIVWPVPASETPEKIHKVEREDRQPPEQEQPLGHNINEG
jgi:hypothetical protein